MHQIRQFLRPLLNSCCPSWQTLEHVCIHTTVFGDVFSIAVLLRITFTNFCHVTVNATHPDFSDMWDNGKLRNVWTVKAFSYCQSCSMLARVTYLLNIFSPKRIIVLIKFVASVKASVLLIQASYTFSLL